MKKKKRQKQRAQTERERTMTAVCVREADFQAITCLSTARFRTDSGYTECAATRSLILDISDSVVNGGCDIIDVARVESGHADATVRQKVNVILRRQKLALLRRQTRERKPTHSEQRTTVRSAAGGE
jgi:hypothetical protein